MKPFHCNGKWITASDCESVLNPFTGEKIADVALADASQVDCAVAAAHEAFRRTRRILPAARSATLQKVAEIISQRREEFTSLIVAEAGKPVTLAEAEVERAALTFQFGAAEALQDSGRGINIEASAPGAGHFGYVRRFPIGVILGITPFNFPLNLVTHKVAPCIATGNAMVLKPALKTPLTALLLAEVLEQAGVPAGQINTVPFHHDLVTPLLDDPRIRMISFTGSVEVGWMLKAGAPRKKVALELGGNAAVIVEADSNWLAAIPPIAAGAYGNAGQSCISVQRILVQRAVYARFRDQLVSHIQNQICCGDPAEHRTVVGPMISPNARAKTLEWIEHARVAGAKMLLPLHVHGLSMLGPVLLEDVPADSAAICEEAFAPLAVLQPYDTYKEALEMVNESRFGLQAGVFTSSLDKAMLAHEALEVGGVLINQVPTFRVENMPYGGVKDSGYGREGLRSAMEEMTEPRTLVIRRQRDDL